MHPYLHRRPVKFKRVPAHRIWRSRGRPIRFYGYLTTPPQAQRSLGLAVRHDGHECGIRTIIDWKLNIYDD